MPDPHACFFIDWLGFLWFGPLAGGIYKRMEGIDMTNLRVLWETKDIGAAMPVDLCEFRRASWTVYMFVQDAKTRKGK